MCKSHKLAQSYNYFKSLINLVIVETKVNSIRNPRDKEETNIPNSMKKIWTQSLFSEDLSQ